ncbi:nicotinate-nucleotide--dimethylbenzimidazole phosphoribosyltransferase (nn:dbi prt) (n(1)-alpha-phosphoribosyltransferase) [Heliomicrobium modesticaldum Ice1]|uniref:Nicotinate-nucleotide--dimethylbenzimidazole phosphoribosyltransferase n=1 Tax=Heliobacterium modesticaldum (strain ATCC 51547 / Ice1) TaxID=498761 RepID=B0TIL0_HELMI|nr:nicotinate-nucleotide--dimethylbenzimidazole phosphoribosyltransferase [Heliomicrobium modesticaldum]ABZ84951.1 nicotinate-nucleotide--dimethylbenzimidazole phosphoribosyltransferase (nn:dbi prt) (n(1)-alpha-phosphoribosyltransferase) [Heliomicrobium modesticaldum Ice1]
MMTLEALIEQIKPLNAEAMKKAQVHLDDLTKPRGSLGVLEDMAKRLAGIFGEIPKEPLQKAIILMAGDHGVMEEGVSAFPQEVTPQMVINFSNGGAGINALARHAGADLICVDVGIAVDMPELPGLIRRKVAYGTKNMTKGPAMTRDEAIQAILIGAEVVADAVKRGVRIVGTGEMGIGNTTPSTAIIAAIGQFAVEDVVGRGTGVNDKQLQIKIDAIKGALEVNQPDPADGLDVLAKVGGLEIAGLVGVCLGAAAQGIPVVIDGFISGAAAVIAGTICPQARDYMIGSHLSEEPGHKFMLDYLGLKPMLMMNFRLGEGTGAALCMTMIDAAVKISNEMATFSSAGVSESID